MASRQILTSIWSITSPDVRFCNVISLLPDGFWDYGKFSLLRSCDLDIYHFMWPQNHNFHNFVYCSPARVKSFGFVFRSCFWRFQRSCNIEYIYIYTVILQGFKQGWKPYFHLSAMLLNIVILCTKISQKLQNIFKFNFRNIFIF